MPDANGTGHARCRRECADLAYVSGSYELTENDASGKPMTDKGKYLEVWKKQANGSWKCVADIFNSDLPPAAPAANKNSSSEKKK